MNNVYITNIPLQGNRDLEKCFYETKNLKIEDNFETSFPIIPVIKNRENINAPVKVIVIRTLNADTEINFGKFKNELKEIGISEDVITEIGIPENQLDVIDKRCILSIIDAIPENSLVTTDITYGTKPMSAVLIYAMNLIDKIKFAEVDKVVYGEVVRKNGKPTGKYAMYDLTNFIYMTQLVDNLNALGIVNKRKLLEELLD
ncbi:MAG: TM1812 family CRISPR-associated protein [Lachnospiraceae bacterium]|nr:TM1812 family CRISPR-associated protein [Lachnospiraceae bacterium]